MRKDLVLSLKSKALEVAKIFSNPDRQYNNNKEVFTVSEVCCLSESIGYVTFIKVPSGKKSLAVFLWINSGEGYWMYFFPTDSHILGLSKVGSLLSDVEVFNFDKN